MIGHSDCVWVLPVKGAVSGLFGSGHARYQNSFFGLLPLGLVAKTVATK